MNYLILLRRADFIDLYKYGFLNVNKERIVPFGDYALDALNTLYKLKEKL